MKLLKLFVWKDVLADWTGGIAFALAESREKALELIKEKSLRAFSECNANPPEIYQFKQIAFVVHGGS